MVDEVTLQDETRKKPKTTRWVSSRGVMRKKQGSGKEKRNAADENYARDVHAGERHVQEIDRREVRQRDMDERGALAREMNARDVHEREMRAREMCIRETHERELRDAERGNHYGSNRRRDGDLSLSSKPARLSDPYDNGVDCEEEYDFDYPPRHGGRSSRGQVHFDDDEEDPEVPSAHLHRLHSPAPPNSQYVNQQTDNTRHAAPESRSASAPSRYHPELPRQRNLPSRARQRPYAQPYQRTEAPQQEQSPWRKQWVPPAAEDAAATFDPMARASRRDNEEPAWRKEWTPPEAENSGANRSWHEQCPWRGERSLPEPEYSGTGRRWDRQPPCREERSPPPAAEDIAADVDPLTGEGRNWDSHQAWIATGNPGFW